MKILITGANGFIGKHLGRELRHQGHDVSGIDRTLTSGHDLAKDEVARYLIEIEQPDYVVHLAAMYGRILCRDQPHRAVVDNAAATTEVAEVCAERGIPVLYASSSEVYGDHGEDEITEDSELREPTTIYGLSKCWGEEALRLYLWPAALCIVRMNMVYGPEQNVGYGQCALSTFIDAAVRGEPFTVHRGTTRSWLYVSDCVRALRTLIEERTAGTWNLGNTVEKHETAAVAEMVLEAAKAEPGLMMVAEPPPDQIRHKNYSCAKLEAALDWLPEVDLWEGINRTVEWAEEEADVGHAQEPVA